MCRYPWERLEDIIIIKVLILAHFVQFISEFSNDILIILIAKLYL